MIGFALLIGSFGIAWLLLSRLPSELAPAGRPSMIGLVVIAPEGTSLKACSKP
ncbi:MAG: hypothetical protein WDN75_06725 [Bacteroidota bacterium]